MHIQPDHVFHFHKFKNVWNIITSMLCCVYAFIWFSYKNVNGIYVFARSQVTQVTVRIWTVEHSRVNEYIIVEQIAHSSSRSSSSGSSEQGKHITLYYYVMCVVLWIFTLIRTPPPPLCSIVEANFEIISLLHHNHIIAYHTERNHTHNLHLDIRG